MDGRVKPGHDEKGLSHVSTASNSIDLIHPGAKTIMRKLILLYSSLCTMLLSISATPARAQNVLWVSATGNDANVCSQTAPCANAVIAAGVTEVVSALEDPNPQVAGAHRRMAAAGIAVRVGPGSDEARRVHAGHIRRVREGRPHVTLKLAVSADGKAGLVGRQPVAITGERARQRVHLMRAMNDAVLGANCLLSAGAMDQAVVPPTGFPSASVQSNAAPPHT